MKKVMLISFVLFGLSAAMSAQSTTTATKTMEMDDHTMDLKNGVMMVDGKMMLLKNSKSSAMKKTYKCDDGCKVAVDGTVTKPDGMTVKLENGQGMDKHGHMTKMPSTEMALQPHKCTRACSANGCVMAHGEKGHKCTDACKKM